MLAWRNLGIAEVKSGRLDEGGAALQHALELARGAGEDELAAQIEAQLDGVRTMQRP